MTTALASRSETERPPTATLLYSLADAARYLNPPLFCLLTTPTGERWRPGPFPIRREVVPPRFTFAHFVSLYVRSAAFHILRQWEATDDEAAVREWEEFNDALVKEWEQYCHDGIGSVHVEQFCALVNWPFPMLSQERDELVRELVSLTLDRIDFEGGEPIRLYPFACDPTLDAPRVVVMDPEIRFGRPALADSGIPTAILVERFRAGESIAEIAADCDLPTGDIEEAIRFESRLPYLTPLV